MTEPTCFECDAPGQHKHHVVPRALGGQRTLWLCERCHGRIHGLSLHNHGILVRVGLARARSEGKRMGQPPYGWSVEDSALVELPAEQNTLHTIHTLRGRGHTWGNIAATLNHLEETTRHGALWTGERVRRAALADQQAREQTAG